VSLSPISAILYYRTLQYYCTICTDHRRARRRAIRDGQTVHQRTVLLSTTWFLRSLAKSNGGTPLQFREDIVSIGPRGLSSNLAADGGATQALCNRVREIAKICSITDHANNIDFFLLSHLPYLVPHQQRREGILYTTAVSKILLKSSGSKSKPLDGDRRQACEENGRTCKQEQRIAIQGLQKLIEWF
jgi:hypothetical protein